MQIVSRYEHLSIDIAIFRTLQYCKTTIKTFLQLVWVEAIKWTVFLKTDIIQEFKKPVKEVSISKEVSAMSQMREN